MAKKPKVVQPGKQAKIPKAYPVDRYPYMAIKPYGEPEYFMTHQDAVKRLRAQVEDTQHQFRHLSEEIRQNCTEIISELGKLPREGGKLDMLLDPYTNTRYRVELVLRRAA